MWAEAAAVVDVGSPLRRAEGRAEADRAEGPWGVARSHLFVVLL